MIISEFTMDSEKQQLLLHQLKIFEYWHKLKEKNSPSENVAKPSLIYPEKWILTKDIQLYDWQKECVEKWFQNKSGTIKVVTGAGKTLIALAIIEKLQNEINNDLRVVIIVPTIVLMNQWYDEIINRSNLPLEAIGRLGGGFKEKFSNKKRILITVLASASKELPEIVEEAGVADNLLFIADECHRLGAFEMSKVFKTKRRYSLGLSATPEREDLTETDEEDSDFNIESKDWSFSTVDYNKSLLGKELGEIIYDFTFVDALNQGIIPHFTIKHYGLELNNDEKKEYEQLTREINKLKDELFQQVPLGKNIFQYVKQKSKNKDKSNDRWNILESKITSRKHLLYNIEARYKAVFNIVRKEFELNPNARIIIFHEKIESVMKIFELLYKEGYPVIAEHSKLSSAIREEGLELFRKGIAKIIVSAKALIEGFNVPEIDIGIIAASSTSVRQRIQSIGRVLRKHKSPSGEEKHSLIYVLYAHNTVDAHIYKKVDWNKITGIKNNFFFTGIPYENEEMQDGPPFTPMRKDDEINDDELSPGCIYPGEYEGDEFTCDSNNNIKSVNEKYVINPGDLAEKIKEIKGNYGRFKVTPHKKHVLVNVLEQDEWVTKYVTTLKEPFKYKKDKDNSHLKDENIEKWLEEAQPGTEYPFDSIPIKKIQIYYKNKRNGIISKKIPQGETFARTIENANDKEKGQEATNLINSIKKIISKNIKISKLLVNEKNHVLYRHGGKLYFIYALKKELEFKEG